MLEAIVVIIIIIFGAKWCFGSEESNSKIKDLLNKPFKKYQKVETKPSAYQNDDYYLGYLRGRTSFGTLSAGLENRLKSISNELISKYPTIEYLSISCINTKSYSGLASLHQKQEIIDISINGDGLDQPYNITVIDETIYEQKPYNQRSIVHTKKILGYSFDNQIAECIASHTNGKYRAEGNRVIKK